MADPKFQLVQVFGTSDLLPIVGIRSIEAFQNAADDSTLLKQSYLRRVIKCHPSTSGIDEDTQEGVKEAFTRSKKLYIMDDIFKFLTDTSNYDTITERKKYFTKDNIFTGTIPDLPSLQYLRNNSFKGDGSDFAVPEFEVVAAELRALYQDQLRKIKEMQSSSYTDPEPGPAGPDGDKSDATKVNL